MDFSGAKGHLTITSSTCCFYLVPKDLKRKDKFLVGLLHKLQLESITVNMENKPIRSSAGRGSLGNSLFFAYVGVWQLPPGPFMDLVLCYIPELILGESSSDVLERSSWALPTAHC